MTEEDYELLLSACGLLQMVHEGTVTLEVGEAFKGVILPSDYVMSLDRVVRLHQIRRYLRFRLERLQELEEL